MAVLTVNVTDLVVVGIVAIIIVLVVWHLFRVYKKSPCGDCASAKQCSAFSKDKILKAYKKQCKLEQKLK
ncbi:MAG: hypothetical protein NC310_05745 [Roseburia sp.]|nr:hypothetical protein [Anaeroplasma bactoclasticum]MCM1196552.1 hypothetical protein [Roseburia sp.]